MAGGLESEPAEDGELLRIIGGVGRKANFAAGYDAGASDLRGGLFHGNVAINVDDSAVDDRQCGKPVGSLAGVKIERPALTIGRNGGQ
jgi:hypothetical protein